MNTLLIVIIIVIIYYICFSKTEKLENISDDKLQLVKIIKDFMNKDSTHSDFIDILIKNKNTSVKIGSSEAFYSFKFILKSRALTDEDILEYLTDYIN